MAARTVLLNIVGNDRVSRVMRGVARELDNAADSSSRLSKAMAGLGKVGTVGGLATTAAGAAALTKAIVPATAAVAALPAAMAAATIASGTLKVGLVGVGDAMSAVAEGDAEALNESLKKLSPNAAAFVRQAAAMRTQVTGLQQAVQNRLFAGLDRDLQALGTTYLPVARTGMVGVAGALNRIGREAARTASTPWFRGQARQVFAGTAGVLNTLRGAVQPLLESVLRLTVAGLPLVQRMAGWAVQGIRVAAAWLQAKTESGELQATITRAGDVLGRLGGIGANVVRTIMNLAGQTRAFGDAGGSLLTTLEQLTSRMAAWSASAQGQQTAATLFRTLGESARQVATALPLLLSPLGLIMKALAGMPPGLQSVVGKMIGWSIIIGVIANRLRALTVITAGWTAATKAATGAMVAFRAVAGAAGLAGFVTGLRNVNAAMAANATTATRLGAALRSQIMLWRQQAAATGVSTARIIANAAAQKIAAAATRVWAAAQAVFNAIMSANPIALIVIGIAALVAAVVLAYRRFEGFRNLVNAVWAGIKTAFMTAWAFLQPILRQIGSIVMTVVAGAFRWLMSTVRTVWSVMSTAIGVAWAVIRPILSTIASVVRTVLGIAFIVLSNVVKAAWIAIQIYIKVAWAIIKGYFTAIKFYVTNVLAPIFRWLYANVIRPAWNGIRAAISTAWTIIRGIFNAIRNVINTVLAPIFRWLWNNVIKPAWNSIKNHISTVYNTGIKPAFEKLRSGVNRVRDAFRTAVDGIRKIWDGLREATRKPVNFVIGVYNNGIVRLVNKIAEVAGLKTRLSTIPKFARGGVLPGYKPGVDELIAAVSPGEAIMRPEFTRAVGAGFIHRANDVARRSGVEGVRRWLTGPDAIGGEGMAFANGGIVPRFAGHYAFGGIIGRFVDGVKNFTIGNVGKAARGLLDKILGGAVPGAGIIRDVVAQIPSWIKDTVLKWVTSKVDSGVGGPAVQRALRFAKAQAGKPYIWGGVGPGGYDCSGFMSAITNVIQGRPPYSRRFTTFSFTGARQGPAGFVRNLRSGFVVGVTNAGVGHMAGTLGGVPVESRGSAGVVVGRGARGATDGLFSMRYGLKFDRGGMLQPGFTLAYNGLGRPEPVFPSMEAAAEAVGGRQVKVEIGPVIVKDAADVDMLAQRLEFQLRTAAL